MIRGHTSAPWRKTRSKGINGWFLTGPDQEEIAQVFTDADAQLVVAAPALLAHVEALLATCGCTAHSPDGIDEVTDLPACADCQAHRAVIALATEGDR